MWQPNWIETLGYDLRFALRALRKSPGFTLVVIAVLALGTGANAAIFSIVNAVLLRPLPFHDPDRVMLVFEKIPKRGVNRSDLCAANFFDLQQRNRSFVEMAILSGSSFALTGDAPPEQIAGARVSGSYFSALGVSPTRGRTFRSQDEDPGAPATVVLSYRLWQRRFGGDDSILGKTLVLTGRAHQVVGIMPQGFQGLFRDHELWVPMQLTAGERSNRGSHFLLAVGRLRPGVTVQQAESDLDAIGSSLEREYPEANTGRGLRAAPVRDELVGDTRSALMLLMGAVSLVLLVACVNVANLLLARALARRREMAIRRALGAAHRRLLQQLLTEGSLLALLGAGAGVLVASVLLRALPLIVPRGGSLPVDDVVIDRPVLVLVAAIGLLAGAFFGCLPAWQLFRSPSDALNERAMTGTGGIDRYRVRSVLLAVQVALSLVLLLGAGLLLRSFTNVMRVQPGFSANRLLTAQIQMPAQQVVFFRQIQDRVRAIPGVEQVAAIEYLPLSGSGVTRRILVEGVPRPEPGGEPIVQRHIVTPDYFRAMNIPVHLGRTFRDADMTADHLVVTINETMARRHWPNQNPIGQHLRVGVQATVATASPREIVGVVGDVRHSGLRADPRDEVYVPLGQEDWPVMYLVVRSLREDPASLTPDVKNAVWAVDKNQTLPGVRPMAQIVAESIWEPRVNTVVLTAFAVVALALALAGIYGLMMRIVADRTPEIGIRIAMGAHPRTVLLLVVRQGSIPVVLGAIVGIGLSIAGGRFVATQLYGVTHADPLTFASSLILVLAAAFLAMMHPAWRATKVDPVVALRHE